MKTNLKLVGKQIRKHRIQNHLTQETLAERSELSVPYISNVERGKKQVSLSSLIAIANALHTTPDALLCDCLPASLPEDAETSDSLSPLSKTEEQFLHEWYVLTKELLNSYEIRSK